MKQAIGQAGIRFIGKYDSNTEYMVVHAVHDDSGNWWVSRKGTKENPNIGNPLPDITDGIETQSEWWRLLIYVQDCVNKTNAANAAAQAANTAKENAETATTKANTAAAFADAIAKNPPMIGEDGYWYFYNYATKEYEKTEYIAKGGVEFPTFSVDTSTMQLQVESNSDSAHKFSVDENGQLCINV